MDYEQAFTKTMNDTHLQQMKHLAFTQNSNKAMSLDQNNTHNPV